MPTRRLSRADVDHERTIEWLMQRDDAETRACPTCRARPGQTCTNLATARPLERQPAHVARLLPAPAPTSSPSRPVTPSPAAAGPREPDRRRAPSTRTGPAPTPAAASAAA